MSKSKYESRISKLSNADLMEETALKTFKSAYSNDIRNAVHGEAEKCKEECLRRGEKLYDKVWELLLAVAFAPNPKALTDYITWKRTTV